jgi:hypothetical protein
MVDFVSNMGSFEAKCALYFLFGSNVSVVTCVSELTSPWWSARAHGLSKQKCGTECEGGLDEEHEFVNNE